MHERVKFLNIFNDLIFKKFELVEILNLKQNGRITPMALILIKKIGKYFSSIPTWQFTAYSGERKADTPIK